MKIKTSNSFPTNLSESLRMIEALEERDKEKMVFVNALYKGGHKNLSAQLYEASCFDYLFFFFVKSLAIKKKKKRWRDQWLPWLQACAWAGKSVCMS